MTINEAVKAGHSTLVHPSFGGNGRIMLHIIPTEDGNKNGPWVTIHDDATDSGVIEPPQVIITDFPKDDKYEPYKELL